MTLGNKIKQARKSKGMTQASLSDGIITKNMLCAIEKGTAKPSLNTLFKLAEKLEIPVSFLLSENEDIFLFEKGKVMPKIIAALKAKNYKSAIDRISRLESVDNELSFILALSHFELAKINVKSGSLISAKKHLEEFERHKKNTIYDLSRQNAILKILKAITNNIQAPLLEFEIAAYENDVNEAVNYEYYKYLTLDYTFSYNNPIFSKHISAKKLIQERKFQDAISLLTELAENKDSSYDSYLVFNVYTDLENCYRQINDYENAYRYSSKRLSLIEGFKS